MESSLRMIMFITSIGTIHLAVVDPPKKVFLRRNPNTNSQQGVPFQDPETNLFTPRISNNARDDSPGQQQTEVLGGYRPLYPPYFSLNNPFAGNKVYYDPEYYTRGTEELDLSSKINQDRDNNVIVKARSEPVENLLLPPVPQNILVPIVFPFQKNVEAKQKPPDIITSFSINFPPFNPPLMKYISNPFLNNLPSFRVKKNSQVTFFTHF